MPPLIPAKAGERFGKMTLLYDRLPGQFKLDVRCDCGTETVADIRSLRSGHTKTCGCGKGGAGNGRFRHGRAGSRIYQIWAEMVARCTRPTHRRYADYGGRGITVCERWLDFANFYADMGERPRGRSLDRIHNDQGYSPENCRWATSVEQRHNRRPQRLKPACKHGHLFTPENTGYTKDGKRRCLTCERNWARERRQDPAHKQARVTARALRKQARDKAVLAAAQALATEYLHLGGDYAALLKLSARLGIGKEAVRVRLRKAGVVPANAPTTKQSRFSPADRIAIRNLHEAGVSQKVIALRFGISPGYVGKLLHGRSDRGKAA